MASGRTFLNAFLMCLLIFVVDGDTRHFNGIPLTQFCNCWNVSITRSGNDLYVDIYFDRLCWEKPLKNPGGFQIITYDTTMEFRIGIYKSHLKMFDYKDLPCQINRGCYTSISMLRDTSLEIIPFCKTCDGCMGKKTDYISYKKHKKNNHTKEIVTIQPMSPPVKESYHSRFLVMAGVVTIIATIATVIIIMLVCHICKIRIQHRENPLLEGGSDTTDDLTDVSVPYSPPVQPDQPKQRRQPVKIGVFHPHMPEDLSSPMTEQNPLDAQVQHMISILTSAQELDVNYLTTNSTNLFEGIDSVSCSPKLILVLCDRFCELCQEGSSQNGNVSQEQWTDTERKLLKRIQERYYENDTCLYFVNFKQFKQYENVLATVRTIFTKHSYKVFSIDSLDQNDIHFKQLLDSVLSDVISESETRQMRIMSLLSQNMQPMCVGIELEERFMSLCE